MIYQDILESRELKRYAADFNTRARKSGATDTLDLADLRDRILSSRGLCEWCGASLVQGSFELDHVISLRQGGANISANLVVSCPDCNRHKGQKHPARFAAEIYSLTGRRTALIDKILQHYSLEAREQMPMFAAENREDQQGEISKSENQPRYRW